MYTKLGTAVGRIREIHSFEKIWEIQKTDIIIIFFFGGGVSLREIHLTSKNYISHTEMAN